MREWRSHAFQLYTPGMLKLLRSPWGLPVNSNSLLRCILATNALLLAACGGVSDQLPPQVFTAKTAAVIRVVPTTISSTAINKSALALGKVMAESKIPMLAMGSMLIQMRAAEFAAGSNPAMKSLDETMADLTAIGGKSICVVVNGDIAEGLESLADGSLPSGSGAYLLVQTNSTSSTDEIKSLISKRSGKTAVVDSLGGGWYLTGVDRLPELPSESERDGAIAGIFDAALRSLPAGSATASFRMTPELRAKFDDFMANGAGMMSAFLAGFQEPIRSLETINATVSLGDKPVISSSLNFSNTEAATAFNTSWSMTTRSLAGMAAMFLGGSGEDSPKIDPALFRGMAEALDMKQREKQLTMTIDEAGWKKLLP